MAAELDVNEPGSGYFKQRGKLPIKFRAWSPGEDAWTDVVEQINDAVPVRAAELRSPLADPVVLTDLLGTPAQTDRGLSAVDYEQCDDVPIGLIDLFEEGRVEALTVPVGRNLAISAGAISDNAFPARRTLVLSMALTRTPDELEFYFIGMGLGYSCVAELAELPHVGAVATGDDEELVGVIIRHLRELLDAREREGGEQNRTVVLVIEQWQEISRFFSWLESDVVEFARRGPDHGIQVVISSRWRVRDRDLLEHFPVRLDLSGEVPGMGTIGGRAFRTALPWLDPDANPVQPNENTRQLAESIASAWPHSPVPRLSLPPSFVPYEQAAESGSPHIVLGRLTGAGRWAEFDLQRTPHLLCLGRADSGKTTMLRVVLSELGRLYSQTGYEVLIVDPKRGLLGEFNGLQIDHVWAREEFERVLTEAVITVEQRLEQPRGPVYGKLFLVLVDFEQIDRSQANFDVLARLERLLVHGPTVGFHVIVTRTSINIDHALHSGLLGSLRSAGCATVVLSSEERAGEILPGVRSGLRPPGRGQYLTDDHSGTIQLAYLPAG